MITSVLAEIEELLDYLEPDERSELAELIIVYRTVNNMTNNDNIIQEG